jgi:hypothetical protein
MQQLQGLGFFMGWRFSGLVGFHSPLKKGSKLPALD